MYFNSMRDLNTDKTMLSIKSPPVNYIVRHYSRNVNLHRITARVFLLEYIWFAIYMN